MPGLTGIELLKRLRSENWHLPAVLMTSLRVDARLREKAAQVGAFSVLEKPIDVDVLLITISQAVFQQRSKRDTAAG
jgi:FixJ family two-component response regulator